MTLVWHHFVPTICSYHLTLFSQTGHVRHWYDIILYLHTLLQLRSDLIFNDRTHSIGMVSFCAFIVTIRVRPYFHRLDICVIGMVSFCFYIVTVRIWPCFHRLWTRVTLAAGCLWCIHCVLSWVHQHSHYRCTEGVACLQNEWPGLDSNTSTTYMYNTVHSQLVYNTVNLFIIQSTSVHIAWHSSHDMKKIHYMCTACTITVYLYYINCSVVSFKAICEIMLSIFQINTLTAWQFPEFTHPFLWQSTGGQATILHINVYM